MSRYTVFSKMSHDELCQRMEFAIRDIRHATSKKDWWIAFDTLQDLKNALIHNQYPHLTTSDLYNKIP